MLRSRSRAISQSEILCASTAAAGISFGSFSRALIHELTYTVPCRGSCPDAELLAGHHRSDLGPQLLTRVSLRSEALVFHQGRPVQPVRVSGRVAQLVQHRVRIGRLRLELAPVG